MSMFEVRVADDFMIDGLAVYVSIKHRPQERQILHLHDGGTTSWDDVDPVAMVEPTIKLPGEAARALLDALLRHYEGASDMHTVRSDLLHERGRVDKLTDALVGAHANLVMAARGRILGFAGDGSPVQYEPETMPPLGRRP